MQNQGRFFKILRPALVASLALMLICGLGFPLLMTGLAQVFFPEQANGSLLYEDGRPIGSKVVGQEFTEPYFLKGRPSAVHYNTYRVDENGNEVYLDGTPFGGAASGSDNYGSSNPALTQRVEEDMDRFLAEHPGISREDIPTDLVTASGSGLDPHISPESAAIQLPAIAEASGISMETLEQIVARNTTGKLLGIFGQKTVNVLGVNAEIASEMGLAG